MRGLAFLAVVGSIAGAIMCGSVAAGSYFGLCQPNLAGGESLAAYYATLFACTAVGFPLLPGLIAAIKGICLCFRWVVR